MAIRPSTPTTGSSDSTLSSDQSTVVDTTGPSSSGPAEFVDELKPDEELHDGETRASTNGRHVLSMTGAGILELRTDGELIWQSDGLAVENAYALMQGDGNLVILPPADAPDFPDPLWDLKTHGRPNAELIVAEDADGSGYIAVVSLDRTEQFFRTPLPAVPTTDAPDQNARTDGAHDSSGDGHGARRLSGGAPSGERRAHEARAGPVRRRAVGRKISLCRRQARSGSWQHGGGRVNRDVDPGVAATTLTCPAQLLPNGGAQIRSDVFGRAV